jgi:integrase
MSTSMSVRFLIRKERGDDQSEAPIYMRVTIAGERFELGTRRTALPAQWSVELGRVSGTNSKAKSVNSFLDSLLSRAYDYQRQILNEGKELTLSEFKSRWNGIPTEKPKMLMEVFEEHNQQMKALIGQEFSPLTFERYTTSKKHTLEFLKWKYKVDDIDIKKLNYEFIHNYEFWLKSVRKCDHNTTIKYLSNFRKIVNICIKSGWLDRDPFVGFKMTKREVERPFLTEDELIRIAEKKFIMPRMSQVRDIFVFCCYTGLAYADVKKLTADEITIGIDGEKWIWTSRQKTDTATRIPLLPPALEILDRYKEDPQSLSNGRLLPVLSNQKMNSYLKEIADACEIKKKMTFHTARHTFATTVTLANDVPMETVSKLLGHRNLKTTQHYGKILDLKVSQDMGMLRAKFKKGKSSQDSATK